MNEFERELQYVKKVINSVLTPSDLNAAKRLKTFFFDKYIMKVSPTDKTWIRTMDELNELEREKTRHITSAYLFRKN